MAHHLFLVGYRGSGKSSIGRRLGEILGLPVVDTDDWVERESGKSIRAIFSDDGEASFRDLETQAIQRLAESREASIVSLGGGAILRQENRTLIKEHGWAIWLQASVDEIARRLGQDAMTVERRPALTGLGTRDEIARLLEIREPIYGQVADAIVQTDHRTLDDIALEIADWYSSSKRSEAEMSDP